MSRKTPLYPRPINLLVSVISHPFTLIFQSSSYIILYSRLLLLCFLILDQADYFFFSRISTIWLLFFFVLMILCFCDIDLDMFSKHICPQCLRVIDYSCKNLNSFAFFRVAVTRSPVTAPPGFSVTSRPPPPPGFSSNGREQQTLSGFSGKFIFMLKFPSRCSVFFSLLQKLRICCLYVQGTIVILNHQCTITPHIISHFQLKTMVVSGMLSFWILRFWLLVKLQAQITDQTFKETQTYSQTRQSFNNNINWQCRAPCLHIKTVDSLILWEWHQGLWINLEMWHCLMATGMG